ncbi:glycosyltransferase [Halomonas sp. BN3-1]|uniref:glycosyltransferase n=1 Tax=Halomonas sp. BN3-1 TaxID=2082393 RepID=UPI000D3BB592|nr:glycosyltransferase [Halomonas sp. BN3-1]
MKVLLVARSFKKGGAASGAKNLKLALESAGAEVVEIEASKEQVGKVKTAARVVERCFERVLFDAETHFFKFYPASLNILRLIENHKPDVVQLCDVSANTISFKDIRKAPCPVIHRMSDFWPYHGAKHYAEKNSQNLLSNSIFKLIIFNENNVPCCRVAPSIWLAGKINENKEVRSKVRHIKNAVVCSSQKRKSLSGKRVLRFGFISGNIDDPRKGFSDIFKGLEYLQAQGQKVELHAFGNPSNVKAVRSTNVYVKFHGPFSKDSLHWVFDEFDILLCPSKLDNSPNVVCESFSYGCPVIAQSGTGIDTYVNGQNGKLFDFQNASDANLERFRILSLEITECYEDYSECAFLFAKNELSPEKIGSEYMSLYRELLK